MTPPSAEAPDEAVGVPAGHVGTAPGWLAFVSNGENVVKAEGKSLDGAYHAACQQAAACGMLGKPLGADAPDRG